MTQKELLYLEDAIGHETNLVAITTFTLETLQDENLKSFVKSQLKKHETLKQKLINAMEDAADE